MSYKLSDTLMLLAESGALDRLASAPGSADALADALGWHAAPLSKLLDLLVTARVLDFANSQYSVPAPTRAALPVILLEAQMRRWHTANQSTHTALTSGKGATPLDRLLDDTFLANYQRAMAASARALALHLVRYGAMPKDGMILDIGGADGALVDQLAALMPDTRFRVIDRPVVRVHFIERMDKSKNSTRCSFVSDDITRPDVLFSQAASARGVIISNVLHLLTAQHIRTLLISLKEAVPKGCRLIVYDQFVNPTQLDVARVMVVDWVNLGVGFDLHESKLEDLLRSFGYIDVSSRRFPTLPGALVCATTP